MFSFQNFSAYQKARNLYVSLQKICTNKQIHLATRDQLHRCSMSVVLNIAEGSGRNTSKDRRRFFNSARSSLFEGMALLDLLNASGLLDDQQFDELSGTADEISRILYSVIQGQKTEP